MAFPTGALGSRESGYANAPLIVRGNFERFSSANEKPCSLRTGFFMGRTEALKISH